MKLPLLLTLLLCAAPALAEGKPSKEFTQAVSDFEAYKAKLPPAWKNNPDVMPFLKVHEDKRARSIVLVHGLTDSPCYMRDLAQTFYDSGYNVVGVRLRGHGSNPSDLHKVKLEQWQEDVEYGVNIARMLGSEVSLAGFSTGGALVLDAVGKLQARSRWNMGDVYLFSPAVDLPSVKRKVVGALCVGKGAAMSAVRLWASGNSSTVEDNACGYKKMAGNGVCQLYRQVVDNERNREAINAGLRGHGVYIVQSKADTTVSVVKVEEFKDSLPAGLDWDLTMYEGDDAIPHADVPRQSTNPNFKAMSSDIKEFIKRCDARHGLRELTIDGIKRAGAR